MEYKKLLKGFDPHNSKWDRRLLFEVTGIRLDEQEFHESDTSDDEHGIFDLIASSEADSEINGGTDDRSDNLSEI